jgi:hypothetical protein
MRINFSLFYSESPANHLINDGSVSSPIQEVIYGFSIYLLLKLPNDTEWQIRYCLLMKVIKQQHSK